jgi:hypothetical protein
MIAAEFALRLFFSPSDYLSVDMVRDEILGGTPATQTLGNGLDKWGFRNKRVPESADIVAIGDSHTYGNAATMEASWPYALARSSGESVYNMGMGGYGPNQYYHLLTSKALNLKPKTIVVGLYIGDDFENAFLITYGLDYWASLRALSPDKVNFDIWQEPPAPTWHKKIRIWLSRNSVLYQIVFHGPLLGRFQGEAQIKNVELLSDANKIVTIEVPDKNILEAFRPVNMLRILDQNSESVREGMRITFDLLAKMRDACHQANSQFVVAIIPTKEMVFAEFLEHKPDLPLSETIDELLKNERVARSETIHFLQANSIEYVDTLPMLRASIDNQLYARTASDMHPNANGYKVIADAIFQALRGGR